MQSRRRPAKYVLQQSVAAMGCRHGLAIQVDEVGEVANRPSCSGNDTYISLPTPAYCYFCKLLPEGFLRFLGSFVEM
jgi:hypothetical protein